VEGGAPLRAFLPFPLRPDGERKRVHCRPLHPRIGNGRPERLRPPEILTLLPSHVLTTPSSALSSGGIPCSSPSGLGGRLSGTTSPNPHSLRTTRQQFNKKFLISNCAKPRTLAKQRCGAGAHPLRERMVRGRKTGLSAIALATAEGLPSTFIPQ